MYIYSHNFKWHGSLGWHNILWIIPQVWFGVVVCMQILALLLTHFTFNIIILTNNTTSLRYLTSFNNLNRKRLLFIFCQIILIFSFSATLTVHVLNITIKFNACSNYPQIWIEGKLKRQFDFHFKWWNVKIEYAWDIHELYLNRYFF